LRSAAVAFVASGAVSLALTPLVRDLAVRRGILDHGRSSRKVHKNPTPRVGGVAIVAAFLVPILALAFVDSGVGRRLWADAPATLGLVVGALAIAGLGVWDDLRGANARTKFAIQFAVALAMYAVGYRIEFIANPFGSPLGLSFLSIPFTVLWIAGIVNAMNLIDGLDGLAGGIALIAVAVTFAVAAVNGEPLMLLVTAALAGSVVGFLCYNFNPATVFMGDTGSMFLGFVLAVSSIRTHQKSSTAVAILVPILALGVPLADTLLAMARRAMRGAPLFSADRGHIHHRLLDRGLSHRATVLVIYGGAIVLAGAGLIVSFANGAQTALVLLVVSALGFTALRVLGMVGVTQARVALSERRRNLHTRGEVRRAGQQLREAGSTAEVWAVIQRTTAALGVVGCELTLGGAKGRDAGGHWSWGMDELPEEALRARYALVREEPAADHLVLAWCDGRETVHRDTEIAIEFLCDHVSAALERIRREAR